MKNLVLTGLVLLTAITTSVAKQKPNIVFLLADDQTYAAMGCYGNPQVKTPNMDKLAEQGIVFNNDYAVTAICMASRAIIMTGMYEYKTGCNFMHGSLTRDKFNLSYPKLLQKSGYRTGFAGKFGFAVTEKPDSDFNCNTYDREPVSDFDWWAGGVGQTSYQTRKNKYIAKYADKYPHSTRAYGAAACDFIKESAKAGKPFCLSVSFKAPHKPFTPDPEFDPVYKNTIFNPPVDYGKKAAQNLATQAKLGRQYLRMFEEWDPQNYQATARKYYQLIYGVDYAIGMIQKELENLGIADNTIIILTSDNGYFCGSHGFAGKVLPYEEGSRTPLIIYDPRNQNKGKQRIVNSLTGNVDIAPTILDLAGVTVPPNMDGVSLVPLLKNPATKVREVLPVVQAWGSAPTFALSVVTQNWKYIYWCYGEQIKPTEELFDLENDPHEMENVASKNKEKLIQMRKVYDKALKKWKNEAVPYGYYKNIGILYDRHIAWKDKKDKLPVSFLDNYLNELKKFNMENDPYNYDEILKRAN